MLIAVFDLTVSRTRTVSPSRGPLIGWPRLYTATSSDRWDRTAAELLDGFPVTTSSAYRFPSTEYNLDSACRSGRVSRSRFLQDASQTAHRRGRSRTMVAAGLSERPQRTAIFSPAYCNSGFFPIRSQSSTTDSRGFNMMAISRAYERAASRSECHSSRKWDARCGLRSILLHCGIAGHCRHQVQGNSR